MSSQDPVIALGTDSFKEILGAKNDDGLVLNQKLNEGKTKMIFEIHDSVGDKGEPLQSFANGSDSHQSGRVLIYSKDRITAGIILLFNIFDILKLYEFFSHIWILIYFTRIDSMFIF